MIGRIRSRALAAGVALALVAGIGAVVEAQGPGPGRRGGRGGPAGLRGLNQLDLTEAQRGQVREAVQRHRQEMQEAGKRLRDAHRAQREAIETVPMNEGLIRSTTQTLANAQTDMALVQARVHNEVWALLTPEQQQKAKQLKEQRETRVRQRLQRRQPRLEG